ncbi:putative virulence effector, partial [Golovinomyces cichoracearum]
MADADSDVDMSPPTTPTRTSSTFPPLTSTPTQRSRTLRFADIYSSQHPTYDPEAPYSPGDPFIAFEKIKEIKVNGNISKATEKVFDKEREVIAKREQIAEEYSRALDEATSCVQELGLGNDIGQLEKALAQ